MIETLAEHLPVWEATTLAYNERMTGKWADVWTETDGDGWNVMARKS